VKGLYKRARAGEIPEFTGVSSPYEEPEKPELVVDTGSQAVEENVEMVINLLKSRGIISEQAGRLR
jgi:adenylylsulfate kinase